MLERDGNGGVREAGPRVDGHRIAFAEPFDPPLAELLTTVWGGA